MENQTNLFLLAAAILNAIAALLHLACIYFGAPLFRFLGTEAMAHLYETGRTLHPMIACIFLGVVLFSWSAYAFSGAGLIPKLPFLRFALIGITAVYLLRALAFPLITSYFPENSMRFWICSSLIVLSLGLIHLIGLVQVWKRL